jgi:hypothetical protein
MEEIKRAFEIATREWENVKASLEICGDIGGFHSRNHARSKPNSILVSEGLHLVRNIIMMEIKLSTYGYFTQEAAYVFTYPTLFINLPIRHFSAGFCGDRRNL